MSAFSPKPMLRLLSFVVLLWSSVSSQAVPGWDLVWSDEFSQADGTVPDPSKWGYDIGGGGWGNQEIQYYTNRPENARIVGGELLIEAREESFGGRNHTSARLLTKGKWDWTYGRFEARVKVPSGSGLWPACWMLGANIDAVSWPNCGEIDIMEQVGRLPKEVFGTIHGPGYSGGNAVGGTYTFVPDVADDYHVFVVEWEEDVIRWYVDGIHYFTATPTSLGGDAWVFDHDFFLILNLAIDGNFAGPLDPAVTFPQQLWVDYVRVYARLQSPDTNLLANAGFESGVLAPWTGYAPGGANDAGGYVESTSATYYNGGNSGGDNVLTRSGQQVAKVFGDFTGGENFNGFYQEVPATPDSTWIAEGWALTHSQDLMVGLNTTWIKVTFRDGADAVLAEFRSPVLGSATVTPETWMNLQVTEQFVPGTNTSLGIAPSMTAPAGSTKVRYEVIFRQTSYDGGSMYFDDLSLIRQADPEVLEDFTSSVRPGTVVSWTPGNAASSYQPQMSGDGALWADLGSAIAGDGVTSVFDANDSPFHRVVETVPGAPGNGVSNPGFETTEPAVHPSTGAVGWTIAAPEDVDPSDGTASMTAETSYGGFSAHGGSRMLVMNSTTPSAPAGVTPPNTNVRSAAIAVDGSTNYDLSFYAAHVVKLGGANPQWNIRFYDAGMGFVGMDGYESFSSVGSSWTKVERTVTTPASAAWLTFEWIQAVGAGNDSQWVTLIDDVTVPVGSAPGGQFVLPVTTAAGLQISWNTDLGFEYQVETSGDLENYTGFGPVVTGDGGVRTVTDVVDAAAKFYRVGRSESP